ncbi:MAG: alpha/beta fold hydrolase [Bacteroidales bacterium]|nr:alpha/beta fold hydrolase [Bacteroidales bacterium]
MKKILLTLFLILIGSMTCLFAQTGTWSGKLEAGGVSMRIVFHLDDPCTLDSPDQGVTGIEATLERTLTGIKVTVPSLGATYEGLFNGKNVIGTFIQSGTSFPLTLSPGEEKLNRPQTPKGPFPYSTEEVSFSNGDAVLKGTLTLPQGWTKDTPVLVMVTGSGFQNRDEEIYEHKPFAVIADHLAKNGIATMRYDDRGFGESTGDVVFYTTEDLKNDALKGVELMRERFSKVGVIGHSEGGSIALMLASEGKADFIVSLAGMVVSGEKTLLLQNRYALKNAGLTDEIIDRYCKALEDVFAQAKSGVNPTPPTDTGLPAALSQNLALVCAQCSTPYMKYFIGMDASAALGKITCPVLALNGTLDTQVDCSLNLTALREGLTSPNEIVPFEGLNHLFQHCGSGDSSEYKDIEETISTEVLEKISSWVKGL